MEEIKKALQNFVDAIDNEEIVMYDNLDHDGLASIPNRLYEEAKKELNL